MDARIKSGHDGPKLSNSKTIVEPSLRANGAREYEPDDRLRENPGENVTPAPSRTVIPRACGVSSTLQLLNFTTDASEYWIARFRGR